LTFWFFINGGLKEVRRSGWCFISILQSARSRLLHMSDMIDAAPVRRKNMWRAIGRILLQYHRNQTDFMAWAAVMSISTRSM